MAIKLYRCSATWLKINNHPCARIEKELNAQKIEFERVIGPVNRSKRQQIEELTGQKYYPVIQFEDGTIYHERSKAMVATIRAGKLDEKRKTGATPPA